MPLHGVKGEEVPFELSFLSLVVHCELLSSINNDFHATKFSPKWQAKYYFVLSFSRPATVTADPLAEF